MEQPIQTRRLPFPKSAGRSFGTPLSNASTVTSRSKTTSKKVRVRVQSKGMALAKRLVLEHKSPAPTSSNTTLSSSATTPTTDNTGSSLFPTVESTPDAISGLSRNEVVTPLASSSKDMKTDRLSNKQDGAQVQFYDPKSVAQGATPIRGTSKSPYVSVPSSPAIKTILITIG